jgi:hypothetical protein
MKEKRAMMCFRHFGAASLGVPEMIQYYRKRIEASRYLNRYLNI